MTPDVDILTEWFRAFNDSYFGGRLPMPRIVTTNSRTVLGQFYCRRRRKLLAMKSVLTDFTIKISTYYDAGERDYRNTLLHEMIHYSIAVGGRRDTSPHGELFRAEMRRLNTQYGWNIRISTPTRQWPVAERNRKSRCYLVLLLTTVEGRHFVSVVNPDYADEIDRMAARATTVKSREWYTSCDEYFARFPKTRSLRGRRIDGNEVDRLMRLMRKTAKNQDKHRLIREEFENKNPEDENKRK